MALLLAPDKFCALLFTALFGLYPMVKAMAEKPRKRLLEYAVVVHRAQLHRELNPVVKGQLSPAIAGHAFYHINPQPWREYYATDLARFPDVLTVEKRAEDLDEMKGRLLAALDLAIDDFNTMRAKEGGRVNIALGQLLIYSDHHVIPAAAHDGDKYIHFTPDCALLAFWGRWRSAPPRR